MYYLEKWALLASLGQHIFHLLRTGYASSRYYSDMTNLHEFGFFSNKFKYSHSHGYGTSPLLIS